MLIQRLLLIGLIFISICASVVAQPKKKQVSAPAPSQPAATPNLILATVGNENVYYNDVERAFQKNMTRKDTKFSAVPRDTALEFLKLYTNYRLKVLNAKERGVDKDSAVKQDIANNRKLLSETFYFDKVVSDARVSELANRRLKELKIAIILSAPQPVGKPSWDSASAATKAKQLIALLNSGASFEKLATDSSDDKETGRSGGVLPWISGGSIIKQVEDEAYRLKPGTFSQTPVQTPFGFFIVKVLESKPRESVKFRHILLQLKENRDSAATMRLADSLYKVFQGNNAANFSEVARKLSDDKASGEKGGYLGSAYSRSNGSEVGNNRLAASFEDPIFKLRDGEFSKPVVTMYGVHIIIRDSTRLPDLATERDMAKRTYRRMYFEEDKRMILDSLQKAYGYQWNTPVYTRLLQSIDTTLTTSDTNWVKSIPSDLGNQVLYKMPSGGITVNQFADSLRKRMDLRGYTLSSAGLQRAASKIADPRVLAQATEKLEQVYPDFGALMQEFNDGILLFKVEEQEVWSKLKFDTTDARAYYESTKSRWLTDRKFNVTEVYVLSDSLAKAIAAEARSGKMLDELAAKYTIREGARDKKGTLNGLSDKSTPLGKKLAEFNPTTGAIVGPFAFDKGYSVVRINSIDMPRTKPFEDAIQDLAPAYQDQLQKKLLENWLNNVRTRFPVIVNNSSVNTIWGNGK